MISIISVNWRADDFADLLKESLDLYTANAYELIIVNNTEDNIGHGEGLNLGVKEATEPYTAIFDIDCHALINDWDEHFLNYMDKYDIIAGKGVSSKPIRPACMFMKTEIAKRYDWSASKGYKGHRVTPEGYDVAICAYHKMRIEGVNLMLIDSIKNRYGTLNGEEWCIDGTPLIYHHWHGTHLVERSVDFPGKDLLADKQKLFDQIPWRRFQLF